MTSLHEHYDQLTDDERNFVDAAFRRIHDFRNELQADSLITRHDERGGIVQLHIDDVPPLAGDDCAERAVDGVARWIIESRRSDRQTVMETWSKLEGRIGKFVNLDEATLQSLMKCPAAMLEDTIRLKLSGG